MRRPSPFAWIAAVASVLALPRLAYPQAAEARCRPADNPLAHYVLRTREGLRIFPAAEVFEIATDGALCAATRSETEARRKLLRDAREQNAAQARAAVAEVRARQARNSTLLSDARSLQVWANHAFDKSRSDAKDAIRFGLDLLLAEGTVLERALDAGGGLVLSYAVSDDVLGFSADSGMLLVHGKLTRGELTALSLKELAAQVGAEAVAQHWMHEWFDQLAQNAAAIEVATARALLRDAAELTSAVATGRAVLHAFDREMARLDRYASWFPDAAAIDGCWVSTNVAGRFRLECDSGSCTITEHGLWGVFRSVAPARSLGGGTFRLDRANDAAALTAVGFQPSLRQEILARTPAPSFLVVARSGDALVGDWYGLFVTKDAKAHLRTLLQPHQRPPKKLEFLRCP
jgi:hypothetical protein